MAYETPTSVNWRQMSVMEDGWMDGVRCVDGWMDGCTLTL